MRAFVFVMLILTALLVSSCGIEREFQQSREMMDTFVTITLYADSAENARNGFEEAFSEISRIEDKFSIYKNNSFAYNLNQKKEIQADDEFKFLIKRSKYYSGLTNGSFDVTVQPVLNLYDESFSKRNKPPFPAEINAALENVNSNNIVIKDNAVRLRNNSMAVTFGGIVKGYAVDKAIDKLKSLGIDSALVNAGGDLYGYGKKGNNQPWKIAIKDPKKNRDYIIKANLNSKAITTSGNYERYFNKNKTFHHIVDPNTGYSANECISVTVIASNATMADALSTGLFAMGPDKGMEVVKNISSVEAMFITSNQSIIYSKGFEH
ncbi:MAG: FAD:protein FMN transferase [Nanobdellota archaeon]